MDQSIDIYNVLDTFSAYLCDKNSIDLVGVIKSSVELLKYCIPAREAVLLVYNDLFMKYSTNYWTAKKKSLNLITDKPNSSSDDDQQTLEEQISLIKSTIESLIVKYALAERDTPDNAQPLQDTLSVRQRDRFRDLITSWAADLLIQMNTEHSETSAVIANELSGRNPKAVLAKQIDLWIDNRIHKLLIDIIIDSNYDICHLISRLSSNCQHDNWFIAYFLLELSKRTHQNRKSFNACMEFVNGRRESDSLTQILAFMSENNPKEIMNVPKIKIPLDLDFLSQLIADKLCAATLDIDTIAQLFKLCCTSLERADHSRIQIKTKHKLCRSLATGFFILLEMNTDGDPKIISHARVLLTCMSLLRQSKIASHILCRALLERSLIYCQLFNPDVSSPCLSLNEREQNDTVKLSIENLKSSLVYRFRRLPNHHARHPGYFQKNGHNGSSTATVTTVNHSPDRYSINSYLLIEAFKSSILDIEAFADLFVEFHCPVMLEKSFWPSDETLRVTNEKNLGVLLRFEQIPPFWDLFELIGQSRCLKNCITLVKALLAAHLAIWASATTKSCPGKMMSTSRLIPPLAESGLIPNSFGYIVEVLPHLSPNEVFAVLSDIWNYLKDTVHLAKQEESELHDDVMARAKLYLARLRAFMCNHVPGSTYVKIFKELYTPAPKIIPI